MLFFIVWYWKVDILWPWETREPGGLPSVIGGAIPPDERKEGDANVCYIFWLSSDWNIHCCPYGIVLYNFQGITKIAATTTNSDGWRKTLVWYCWGKPLLWLSFFYSKYTISGNMVQEENYICIHCYELEKKVLGIFRKSINFGIYDVKNHCKIRKLYW